MKIKEIICEYKGSVDDLDIDEPEEIEEPEDKPKPTEPEVPDEVDMDEPIQPSAKQPRVEPEAPAAKQLPMDRTSRMDRAKAKGFDAILYHASTHDISEFDASKSAAFNDWGSGIYASNSLDDVNANYAGEGPDMTHRIGSEEDNVNSEIEWNDNLDELLDEYGISADEYEDDPNAVVRQIAKARVMGEAEHGVVYPIMVNRSKFVSIGGPNPTVIPGTEFDVYIEQAKDDVNVDDYESEDDYDDALRDRAYEIHNDDEDSPYAKVYDACLSVIEDENSVQEIMANVQDDQDGDIDLTALDKAIRDSDFTLYTDSGNDLTGGAISAAVFAELGFEGVIDYTVNRKFGSQRRYGGAMVGMDPDTVHTIIFPGFEHRARSVNAAYDHDLEHSKSLMASDDTDDKEVEQDPELKRIVELAGIRK